MGIREKIRDLVVRRARLRIDGMSDAPLRAAHLSFVLGVGTGEGRSLLRIRHPNRYEFYAYVRTLRQFARGIIVTDYRYAGPSIDCDVSVGFGRGLRSSVHKAGYLIYYATGCAALFQIGAVTNEVKYIGNRYGYQAYMGFRIPEFYSGIEEHAAKRIYVVGNRVTASTFNVEQNVLRRLPGIALGECKAVSDSNASYKKGELLWLGSQGILHKGLHIAADVARTLNAKLIIVGVAIEEEALALQVLKLADCDYELHRFIVVGSKAWLQLVGRVSIVIGCSVSEGMATGLLTCARYGLVPVSTDTCGVDVGSVVDFLPRETLVERFAGAVTAVLDMDREELYQWRCDVAETVSKNNSRAAFEGTLLQHMERDLMLL